MKVAYFHHSGDLYGASKSLLYLLDEVRKRGVVPLVVLAEDGPFQEILKERGFAVELVEEIPVLRRRMLRSFSEFLRFFLNFAPSLTRVSRILREFGIDLVHSNDLVIGLAPGMVARKLKIPHVWHIRSNLTEFALFTPFLRRLVLALGTSIIGVSQSIVRQMAPSDTRKVRKIFNGLPPEIIGRQLPFDASFRSRNGFAADDIIVCCVGRINRWKGQGFLARAFASVRTIQPEKVKLLFVGDAYPGSEFHQAELDAQIDQVGIRERTTQIGFITDIRSVYEAIDILVVPSVVPEPFGLVVLEGMVYGRPVIAANHGGPSEILQNRVTGLLYDPDDLTVLTGLIRLLVEDDGLRRDLGTKARRFMEHAFSISETTEQVTGIYRSCLNKDAGTTESGPGSG